MSNSFVSHAALPSHPLWDRMQAQRRPLSFDIEITARCHNDCRHCYINVPASDREAASRELTVDEISRIAKQATSMGVFWALITGGEPLLRKDFPEVYLALKRQGLLVSVFTTACLVTREHVELFRKYPPRDVEVTVYGATQETYERVTRKAGSYAAFRRGLDLLIEGGIKVRLKAMALRSNLHELDEITRFCQERTAGTYRFDPKLHLRYDGDPLRNAEIREERLTAAEIAELDRSDPDRFSALQEGCGSAGKADHGQCDRLFHCGAGEASFSVGWDGSFRLCSSLHHPQTVFDLRRGSLADAWQNLVPRVRDLRSESPEFLSTCLHCPIVNLCLWCPAHAHLETGEMDAHVGYFCAVAHERARQLSREAEESPRQEAVG